MPEFKVQCEYYGERKNKFFHDKKEEIYHKFCVINANDLPNKYFRTLYDSGLGRHCWLWISSKISKEAGLNWEKKKDYCFIMNLGEKTAAFNIENRRDFRPEIVNNMVLKSPDYWKNTIKKIGFWDRKDYFYEHTQDKKQKKPTKNQNNSPTKPENKNDWGKIALICLPIVILAVLLLIIKWVSEKNK